MEAVCEQGMLLKAWIHKFGVEWYGERCADFEPDCLCCKFWKAFDEMWTIFDPE